MAAIAAGKNKTILVVDDDQELLDLIALVLAGDGYQIQTASNGQEGLEVVERKMPNLVLLDMKMPVMDGWEFAREFRARYDRQAPIIVLTASVDAKKKADEVAAADWIGKPFDIDILLSTVRRAMSSI